MQQIKLLIFLIISFLTSCTVSFVSTDINYDEVKTFSVDEFYTEAALAPLGSGQIFSEKLKTKILDRTRLLFVSDKGDINFSGSLTEFSVSSLAPTADQLSALQRLRITISVNMKKTKGKEGNWDNKRFTKMVDFSAEDNLIDVQDALMEELFEQILEDVFSQAFTAW